MKAITLFAPWAVLAVAGDKGVETRSWRTKYRGRMAIHSGGAMPPMARRACAPGTPIGEALRKLGHDDWRSLPRGAVLGEVVLVDCLKMHATYNGCGKISLAGPGLIAPGTRERDFGIYAPGRWAWMLHDPTPYEKPIVGVHGQLGLWDWDGSPTAEYEDGRYAWGT